MLKSVTFMSATRSNLYIKHRNTKEEEQRFLWHPLAVLLFLILLTSSLSKKHGYKLKVT